MDVQGFLKPKVKDGVQNGEMDACRVLLPQESRVLGPGGGTFKERGWDGGGEKEDEETGAGSDQQTARREKWKEQMCFTESQEGNTGTERGGERRCKMATFIYNYPGKAL